MGKLTEITPALLQPHRMIYDKLFEGDPERRKEREKAIKLFERNRRFKENNPDYLKSLKDAAEHGA